MQLAIWLLSLHWEWESTLWGGYEKALPKVVLHYCSYWLSSLWDKVMQCVELCICIIIVCVCYCLEYLVARTAKRRVLWECMCALMYGPLPVSQWRNDKPFSAAQEFILVDKAHVCDVDDHLVWVLIEVETALLQPLKVVGAFDMQPAL